MIKEKKEEMKKGLEELYIERRERDKEEGWL